MLGSDLKGARRTQLRKLYFLALLTAFSGSSISDQYFKVYADVERSADWLELFRTQSKWDSSKYRATVEELAGWSLLSCRIATPGQCVVSVYPNAYDALPQDFFERGHEFTMGALRILEIYLAHINELELPLDSRIETLRHLDACLQQSPESPFCAIPKYLIDSLGRAFRFGSKYESHLRLKEAVWLFEEAVVRARELLGPLAGKTIYAMDRLGYIYIELGKFDKAEVFLMELWHLKHSLYGPNHPSTLATIENLSTCHCRQGRRHEVDALRKIVLDKYLEAHDINPRSVSCQRILKNPAQSLTDGIIVSNKNPAFHLQFDALTFDHNRATILADGGRFGDAERIFASVLKKRRNQLGDKHPLVLSTRKNLGAVMIGQGRYVDALHYIISTHQDAIGTAGEDSSLALSVLDSLAQCLSFQDNYVEAVKVLQKAYNGCREILGQDRPQTLEAQHNLGFTFQRQGAFDLAERTYQEVLIRRTTTMGQKHPETIRIVNNLTAMLNGLHRGDGARNLRHDLFVCSTFLERPEA